MAIALPIVGQEISVANFGIPVANQLNTAPLGLRSFGQGPTASGTMSISGAPAQFAGLSVNGIFVVGRSYRIRGMVAIQKDATPGQVYVSIMRPGAAVQTQSIYTFIAGAYFTCVAELTFKATVAESNISLTTEVHTNAGFAGYIGGAFRAWMTLEDLGANF